MRNLIIFFVLSIFLFSCNKHKEDPKIVFSCYVCKGCVEKNLKYIIENDIDDKIEIQLNKKCMESIGFGNLINRIKYTQVDERDLEKEYGVFGNFLWIDKEGNKMEFETDMNLIDYLKL